MTSTPRSSRARKNTRGDAERLRLDVPPFFISAGVFLWMKFVRKNHPAPQNGSGMTLIRMTEGLFDSFSKRQETIEAEAIVPAIAGCMV